MDDDAKTPGLQTGDSRSSPDNMNALEADEATIDNGSVNYRVYKRRWFGLALLTLLNITASFDVSAFISQFK